MLIYEQNNLEGATHKPDRLYALPPAFAIGIQDSMNPFALSALLVFYAILVMWSRKRVHIAGRSILFLSAFVGNIMLLAFGTYDKILMRPIFERAILGIHLGLSLLFILIGMALFIDWVRKRKGNREGIVFLNTFGLSPEKLSTNNSKLGVPNLKMLLLGIGILLMTVALGWGVSLLTALWPQNYVLFLNFYYGLQNGDPGSVWRAFFYYALGFSFSFFLLAMAFFMESKVSSRERNSPPAFLSIVQSAIFIAMGFGLIQLWIQSTFI